MSLKRFGIELVDDLADYAFVKGKMQKIPYDFARARLLLPLDEQEGVVLVAMVDPLDLEAIEEVRHLLGCGVRPLLVSQETLEEAIEYSYNASGEAATLVADSLKNPALPPKEEESEGYDLLGRQEAGPVIRLLNAILLEAISQGASDVHFEPLESGLLVRYRIDGVLQTRHNPPREYQNQLVTRIKVMARLDIAESRLPQDGRIKLKVAHRQIDFRVSTLPVVYGERIVLRILDKSNVILGLGKIGMREKLLGSFRSVIGMSEGIVLVTGPTGSGKTTTLYSALSEINSQEINIMTIEDPVEFKLQGMAQIGVNPKIQLTFATGLRHILRQDPDVIMIGEIRDRETAEIAIQASLTGHLVLSTLHTNDAPSALTRLVDMGIEPYLLSSSILAVLAQRLVRRICPHCRVSYAGTSAELGSLGLEGPLELFRGEGCPECFGTGYKGRVGIYEMMPLTSSIKRQLIESPESFVLQRLATEEGMETLREDGGHLVAEGVTTSAEVLRACAKL